MPRKATGRTARSDETKHWFPASKECPALTFYKLEVDAEDTVYYADEKEAWEATKYWDTVEQAGQITLTEYVWYLTDLALPEVNRMLVKLITAARTTHTKRGSAEFDWLYDGMERAKAVSEACEQPVGGMVLFSVGSGDPDINCAPDWIRWTTDGPDSDGAANQ